MKIKNLLLTLCLAVLAVAVKSQDIHFTQYANSPLSLNPANTGEFYGDWRAVYNFRSQWSSVLQKPITSHALSYDRVFFTENDDRIGVGLFAVNDQAGTDGFMTNRFALSVSYIKMFGIQELRFGVQGAYTMKSFDNNLSFPESWNPDIGEFDPELTELEPLNRDATSFGSFNAGVAWKMNYEMFRPTVGLAAFHVNSPKENFFANDSRVSTRVAAHASFLFLVQQEKIFIDPNFLIMSQSGAKNIIMGVRGGYKFDGNNLQSAYFGIAVRNGFSENPDAFILQGGVGIANLNVGLSYDFNVSPLKGTQSNGTIEASVIYVAPSTRLIKTKIESERL